MDGFRNRLRTERTNGVRSQAERGASQSHPQVASGLAIFLDLDLRVGLMFIGVPTVADWLGPKNFRQAGESWDFFRSMQAVIRSTSGISELQSRKASGRHASSSSGV